MTNKEEVKIVKGLFKSMFKEDKHWFQYTSDYVVSQPGGSAKGWTWENSLISMFDLFCIPSYTDGATNPNTDITIEVFNDSIPIQVKAYSTPLASSKIQLSTMAQTNYYDEGLQYFEADDGSFNGKEYSNFLKQYSIPLDVVMTTDSKTMDCKLYVFHFIDLFKKTESYNISGKNNDVITIFARDKKNELRAAFTIGPDMTDADCYKRGIWIQNWFLMENEKPIKTLKAEKRNVFMEFIKQRRLEDKSNDS